MAAKEVTYSSNNLGFTGVLTITFIVLKLTGVIGWSWWWVLSPTWIPIAFWLSVMLIAFVVVFLGTLLNPRPRKRRRGRTRW